MTHLTIQQMVAHLDGELTGPSLKLVEKHFAECEPCWHKLEGLAEQDALLAGIITHDAEDAFYEALATAVEDEISGRRRATPPKPVAVPTPADSQPKVAVLPPRPLSAKPKPAPEPERKPEPEPAEVRWVEPAPPRPAEPPKLAAIEPVPPRPAAEPPQLAAIEPAKKPTAEPEPVSAVEPAPPRPAAEPPKPAAAIEPETKPAAEPEPTVIVPVRETVAAEPPKAQPPAPPRGKATPARPAEPPGFSALEPPNARDLPSDSESLGPRPAPAGPEWATPEPRPPHSRWVPPELIPTEPAWVTPKAAVPPRPAAKPRPPRPTPPAAPASEPMLVAATPLPPAPVPVRPRTAAPIREEPPARAQSAGPGTWVLGAAVTVLALTLGLLLFLGFSRQDGSFSIGRWQIIVKPASAPGSAPAPSEGSSPRDTLAQPTATDSPEQEAPAVETGPAPTAPPPHPRAKPVASGSSDPLVRSPGVLAPVQVVHTESASATPAAAAPSPAPAGAEPGVLCGTVRDSEGRPVTRAQVMMADAGVVVLTDRSGRFCLSVPVGERTLSVVAPGFASERLLIIVSKRTPELTVTLQASAPEPVKP